MFKDNNKNDIPEELKLLLEEQQGVVYPEMDENTRIEDDLGIRGDDAVEFLIAFGRKFDVDVSRFNVSDYFYGENWPFDWLGYKIRELFTKKKYVKKVLTIGDLLEAIRVKRLGNSEVYYTGKS